MTAPTSQESKHIFTVTPTQRDALLSTEEQLDPSFVQLLKESFDKHGFVLVRGLLDDQLQTRICSAGKVLANSPKWSGGKFTSIEFGPVFNLEEDAFRDVSLNSSIPALVARVLLDVQEDDNSLRLLKDAFMAKGKEEQHCGWHVDDSVFWPTDSASCGVNAWISLDNIQSKYGGGMAVSPQSHTAEWRQSAYESIGSTPTLPPEGIGNRILQNIGKTCEMASLNQELNQRIEESKLVFDYQPGDCLFCHRWLFHRSVPINAEGMNYYDDSSALKRYTIRYERGSARLIKGRSVEPCVLVNSDNSGRSLDEVCKVDGPYFPQCWPQQKGEADKQESDIKLLAREKLPDAHAKKLTVFKELSELAQEEKGASGGYS